MMKCQVKTTNSYYIRKEIRIRVKVNGDKEI